jgi:hypothetical protein
MPGLLRKSRFSFDPAVSIPVGWRDDIPGDIQMTWDNIAGPGMLYGLERHFWLDL